MTRFLSRSRKHDDDSYYRFNDDELLSDETPTDGEDALDDPLFTPAILGLTSHRPPGLRDTAQPPPSEVTTPPHADG